jgi:hypothetical protein
MPAVPDACIEGLVFSRAGASRAQGELRHVLSSRQRSARD